MFLSSAGGSMNRKGWLGSGCVVEASSGDADDRGPDGS